jgi:hypothetical protein
METNPQKIQELAYKFFRNSDEDFRELLEHLWLVKDEISPQLQLIIFSICGNLWDQINGAERDGKNLGEALENSKNAIVMDPRFDEFTRNAFPSIIGGIIANRARKKVTE